jgi:hypothetical protein
VISADGCHQKNYSKPEMQLSGGMHTGVQKRYSRSQNPDAPTVLLFALSGAAAVMVYR